MKPLLLVGERQREAQTIVEDGDEAVGAPRGRREGPDFLGVVEGRHARQCLRVGVVLDQLDLQGVPGGAEASGWVSWRTAGPQGQGKKASTSSRGLTSLSSRSDSVPTNHRDLSVSASCGARARAWNFRPYDTDVPAMLLPLLCGRGVCCS